MNISVFLDGTWDRRVDNTDVVQLASRVPPTHPSGLRQLCHYDSGVGTTRRDKYGGGAFGWGLDANINEAYRFIAGAYGDADDQIFICGFSRGAFTARSLAGMIAHCGLVHPRVMSFTN